MKKLLMISLILCLVSIVSFSQTNNMSRDVTFISNKTKTELYSNAKIFITNLKFSANDIIKHDNKETGLIILKENILSETTRNDITYYFNITIKIYVRNNKYRIVVDNIYNSFADANYGTILINNFRSAWKDNMSRKKYWRLMKDLENDINALIIDFISNMNETDGLVSDW